MKGRIHTFSYNPKNYYVQVGIHCVHEVSPVTKQGREVAVEDMQVGEGRQAEVDMKVGMQAVQCRQEGSQSLPHFAKGKF